MLDDELQAWRDRAPGEVSDLFLDARYEKSRQGGVVRDAAVLSAFDVGADGRRRILGVSVALSAAEVHWRDFLESLVARGRRGVRFITADDHAGLKAARKAVLGGAIWQRCQFHLAQNAIHHAPTVAIRKRPGTGRGGQLSEIWHAKNLAAAEDELKSLVDAYRKSAPELAARLEIAVPEGLAVLILPEHHGQAHAHLQPDRTRRPAGARATNLEVRVFPNNASRLRLVTAVLVEIDETRQASTQPYINWNTPDARMGHQRISRHQVAQSTEGRGRLKLSALSR